MRGIYTPNFGDPSSFPSQVKAVTRGGQTDGQPDRQMDERHYYDDTRQPKFWPRGEKAFTLYTINS